MNKNKYNFFQINLGHILVLSVNILLGGVFVGRLETKINNHDRSISNLAQKVDKLDSDGSQSAKATEKTLSDRTERLDVRVTRLEEYIPKIAVLSSDLKNLYDLVKEIKEDVKKINFNP